MGTQRNNVGDVRRLGGAGIAFWPLVPCFNVSYLKGLSSRGAGSRSVTLAGQPLIIINNFSIDMQSFIF